MRRSSYAVWWNEGNGPRNVGKLEIARLHAQTNPHSPGKYRTNGVVSNMPEFQKAFACTQGQPMVRENACRVW